MLDRSGVFGGKAVQFLGDGPDGRDHVVIGEHGRDGDKGPTTVAMSAPATPGAIAFRVADRALAMPEKVSMTPQTVPSKPMNGPPATAVERIIIPFSNDRAWALATRSSVTRTESNEAWLILAAVAGASSSDSASPSPP